MCNSALALSIKRGQGSGFSKKKDVCVWILFCCENHTNIYTYISMVTFLC